MSFSPQTHNLCQQHFLFADHKPSQFHHQTRPIRRAPFLQPSAFDEACGGRWGPACACGLALPAPALLHRWHLPLPPVLHSRILVGGWQVACACAWVSLARSLLSEPKEETTLISRKAPGLYFSVNLSFDQWCTGGLLPVWNIIICKLMSSAEKHQIGKVVLKTTGLMSPRRGEILRVHAVLSGEWGILLEAWCPPEERLCALSTVGPHWCRSGDRAFIPHPHRRHSSSVL